MKKETVFLLFSALLLISASSCGQNKSDAVTKQKNTAADTAQVMATTETEEPKVDWTSAGIEAKDFGGRTFTTIIEEVSGNAYAWYRFAPEENDGETLNDALVQRNSKIEEVFNVDIREVSRTTIATDFRKAVTSGDNSYDCALDMVQRLFALAQDGLLVNWYDLPGVNLKAPWWDSSVVDQLTVHYKLYFCTGDISPATNIRVYSLVFNKDLCRSLGIDLPYDHVKNGTWTIDVFNQYITDVNHDVNGDGKMDYDDRWGYFSQSGNSFMMYFAGGGTVVSVNENEELVLTLNLERNLELAVKALEISIDDNKTLMADPYVQANGGQWPAASAWFAGGNALMRSSVFEPVPRDYRSMETDFGVLPYPKMDENQDRYYTPAEEASRMFGVPQTADLEFVGTMLEVLAAESVSTVSTAFYDVCLQGKSVRDVESAEILNILFDNKVFDYALIHDMNSFKNMMKTLESKKSTDVASTFASETKKLEKNLIKISKALEDTD